jgi:hypothetical protein
MERVHFVYGRDAKGQRYADIFSAQQLKPNLGYTNVHGASSNFSCLSP